jgi:DNA-binding GntR family transcriptional regulator
MAAAHTADGIDAYASRCRTRARRARPQLVESGKRQRGGRGPDSQCAVELSPGDPFEQIARNRLVGGGRCRDGSGRDDDLGRLTLRHLYASIHLITASALTPISRTGGARAGLAVYSALHEAIVATELQPGRQISENEIADKLGVSRTPVREALARLRDDQLVQIVPQLGTFVSRISVAGVDDAQFLREALECSAVRLAAERVDPSDMRGLNQLIERQEHARDAADANEFFVLDDELHSTLCELSGRPIAWTIVARANGHLNRVRRLSLAEPRYIAEMIAEHKEVVDAVGSGDADAAETALRHHLRMVLSDLPTIRTNHPEYFEDN